MKIPLYKIAKVYLRHSAADAKTGVDRLWMSMIY